MNRPRFAKTLQPRKRKRKLMQVPLKPQDISKAKEWEPVPFLDDSARAATVGRCATMERNKAAAEQVSTALQRIDANLRQTTTFAESDAKRARLLERVRALQQRRNRMHECGV